ncbi:hypothetical protein POX_b03179 [Penicillium oxalicum]|uniref:hypothetical protein n=1 Tax=Penicillium oxalicum TaxID=69781 RepID=UPI0020B671A4|nr:hypothetical protein POX_b03179 [Penicillium oxalicum]KAI2793130.1 hypothetical protein POX_b03179 [Penicillium oxalicum]
MVRGAPTAPDTTSPLVPVYHCRLVSVGKSPALVRITSSIFIDIVIVNLLQVVPGTLVNPRGLLVSRSREICGTRNRQNKYRLPRATGKLFSSSLVVRRPKSQTTIQLMQTV